MRDLYEDPDSFWSFGWSQGRETLQGDTRIAGQAPSPPSGSLSPLLLLPRADGKPDMHKGSFYANPCSDKPTEDPVLMKKFPSYCR